MCGLTLTRRSWTNQSASVTCPRCLLALHVAKQLAAVAIRRVYLLKKEPPSVLDMNKRLQHRDLFIDDVHLQMGHG